MGERIRQFNWGATSIGPVETWPQNLRTCIRIMLTSRQPIWIGWGKELLKFYNDPYQSIVGGKHPWALGRPASVVWKDIWREIGPMLKTVMEKDEGTYVESQLLIMERNGYAEETYYTFSYTAIPGDDGKPAGMICANTDDTDRIISERQLRTLSQLGKTLNDCKTDHEIIDKTITTLKDNPYDFPFALFYTINENDTLALVNHTELGDAISSVPHAINLQEKNEIAALIIDAAEQKQLQVFEGLRKKLGDMPQGAWNISPDAAIILPVIKSNAANPYGYLVVGINPFRLLTEEYKSFFSLVTDQVAKSFTKIHALEEERKRSEALAEIDKAKTKFFSNISHEFRTPLTLLLGPVSDILQDAETSEENKERLQVVYRNALRMQKLVNTLLDFSKIEAGRLDAKFAKTDICKITSGLASTFRAAIEKAGMQLKVDCETIDGDVYIDIDMWEKIVLNLISNAFKYSKKGTITVSIKRKQNQAIFSVSDEGIGIPADQLEKIFDRFHRVESIDGRSEEGTGIGLSLVRELVGLHKGSISVKSEPGIGSSFSVAIPVGSNHLDISSIVNYSAHVTPTNYTAAFVEESLKWLPDNLQAEDNVQSAENIEAEKKHSKYTVLLADDNADMRTYVQRLLSKQFNVVTASNGEEAFAKIKAYEPDLVLTDVMMPVLNGFELLYKIRSNKLLTNIPVIFLSARAGEEAKVEGLEAGADDYMVKPFTARELLARVDGNIRIAKSRMAAEQNLQNIIMQTPVPMAILKGDDLTIEICNENAYTLTGRKPQEVTGKSFAEAFEELTETFLPALKQVYKTGNPFSATELPLQIFKNQAIETFYLNVVAEPLRNEIGKIAGIIVAGIDVTIQVNAIRALEKNQRELTRLANAMPQLVWIANADGEVIYYNDRVTEFSGSTKTNEGTWLWQGMIHSDDLKASVDAWQKAVQEGTVYQIEHRVKLKDGTYKWHLSRGVPQKNEDGKIIKWFGTSTDIQVSREYSNELEQQVLQRTFELQELNKILQQSNNDLQQFAHVASHDLKEPLRKIKTFSGRLLDDKASELSDRGKVFVEKMNSATDRMYAMIDGVLKYSTINAGDEQMEVINLNEIFRQILLDLEILINEKNATLFVAQMPVIEGAAVLIYQLFYNLINNALKFSGSERKPVISITSSVLQTNKLQVAEITVVDNGIGFENIHAEKIFDPFARLNSKDKYEGTGLGLSLCKKIVQRHGGTISAKSKKDEGAAFTVTLPLKIT